MFIDSTQTRVVNDTARLSSPPVSDGRVKCLTFWYYMYGPDINTLNVYIKVGVTYGSPVWRHTGTVANSWQKAMVTITNSNTYNIVFEGVRGTHFSGDIGLDDITVVDDSCGK